MSLHPMTRINWADDLERFAAKLQAKVEYARESADEKAALLLDEQVGGLRCAARDLRELSLPPTPEASAGKGTRGG